MARRGRRDPARPLAAESLEDRMLLAAVGIPWTDPRHLTLSFAPDGTGIAAHQSELFTALDATTATSAWQREILRAFQTWAVHVGVNVSLVTDSGDPFGTPGETQGAPRFGDIRVGAHAMSAEVLSISVPHDPFLSGTWAGDVLLNSSYSFDGIQADLFSTMLHEAGHVFGLGHSDDPHSVMFAHAGQVHTELAAGDIAAIRALYGARAADRWEGNQGNNSPRSATRIRYSQVSDGYDGSTPLVLFGDVTTRGDVDFFSLRPLDDYSGAVTFRAQTAGVSLLQPRLAVFDSLGTQLGQAVAGEFGSIISVHLPYVDPGLTYFARVDGATTDEFGIGGFGLAATFDDNLTTPPEVIDELLSGAYEDLRPDDFDEVIEHPETVFVNDDLHANDTFATATNLKTTAGFARNSHYETSASIADATDVDVYRVKAGDRNLAGAAVLTATVRAADLNGVVPRVRVFDGNLAPVAAEVIVNGNGTYTVQVAGAAPRANYFLAVRAMDGQIGNYTLKVNVGSVAANLETFHGSTLTDAAPETAVALYVAQSQLFQFVLAGDGSTGAAVEMTIFDEVGGTVFTLTAPAGDAISGDSLLLAPGAYSVRFRAIAAPAQAIGVLGYTLRGASLSDPIGPVAEDPTLDPQYTCPEQPGAFCYPGGRTSTRSFLWDPQQA